MGSKVGIVYATNSKIMRRIIVPTQDSELDHVHVAPGETLLVVDSDKAFRDAESGKFAPAVRAADAAIAVATGVVPPSARCAEVRDGKVVAVRMADPEIDTIPGALLVKSAAAEVGWDHSARDGLVRVAKQERAPKKSGGDPLA